CAVRFLLVTSIALHYCTLLVSASSLRPCLFPYTTLFRSCVLQILDRPMPFVRRGWLFHHRLHIRTSLPASAPVDSNHLMLGSFLVWHPCNLNRKDSHQLCAEH